MNRAEILVKTFLRMLHSTYYILHSRRGVTLIELLISIAILMTILGVGFGFSARTYRRYIVDAERDTIVNIFLRARSRAMANVNGSAHGIYVGADDLIVFQGVSYASRAATYDEIYPRTAGLAISGPSEFVFQALHAAAAPSGTLTIGNEVKSVSIGINDEGRIDW